MSRLRCRLAFSLLLLFLPIPIQAQEIAVKNDKPDPALEKKAVDLLETVAAKVPELKSVENRISLTCKVADLIWARDEKRGRALFESVTKDMREMIGALDLSDPQAYNAVSVVNQQRQEVIGRLAQHDPDMALSFLKATRFPIETTMWQNFERSLEINIARVVVARDPERALKVARESLARGLSYDMISLLSDLQRKSPDAAQKLYEAIVDQVKTENFFRNQETSNMAVNLVTSFVPPQANEQLYRDLLDTVVKSAMSLPGDMAYRQQVQNLAANLRSAESLVEKYLPSRADAFRQWTQSASNTMDASAQIYNEINEVVQKGTIDDVLALAPKYPVEMRQNIYQQAAWKASNSGDEARARQIANEFISDPAQRRQILDQLKQQKFWRAINENKVEEARAMLSQSLPPEQRAQLLERIATMLVQKDDKKGALDCLNQARAVVAELPRGSQKLWQQFQLSGMYFQVDPKEGFTIIEPIVAQTNELVNAAAVTDGFENRYLKDGEWMPNGGSGIGNIVQQLRQALALLARYDFDRAEGLAEQLERTEIRLQTQVDIAQVALSGNVELQQVRFIRGRRFE
jgi:hypothetical protein